MERNPSQAGTNSKPDGTKSKFFGTKSKSISFRESRLFNGLSQIPAKKAFAAPFPGQGPPPNPPWAFGRACRSRPAVPALPMSIASMGTMLTPTSIFRKQMFVIVVGGPLRRRTNREGCALMPEFDRPLRETRSRRKSAAWRPRGTWPVWADSCLSWATNGGQGSAQSRRPACVPLRAPMPGMGYRRTRAGRRRLDQKPVPGRALGRTRPLDRGRRPWRFPSARFQCYHFENSMP